MSFILVTTVTTGKELRLVDQRLRRKNSDLERLRRLEQDVRRYRDTFREYEKLAAKSPAPIHELLAGVSLRHKARMIEDTTVCPPGWSIRKQELDFSEAEVAIGEVMQLIAKLELESGGKGNTPQQPPWRVSKCFVKSSSQAAGLAEVVLTVEALEKKMP